MQPIHRRLLQLLLPLLLFLPVYGHSEEVYHLRRLSESELLKTYTAVMRDACHYADRYWTNWSVDPRGGMWGSGRSDNMNEGIRSISDMVLTCSALLKYDHSLGENERSEYRRKAIAGLRYATASHVTGLAKCTDGKPWGNSWQSAMWTGNLAFGAWLMGDDVDADLRKDLERVVAFEADRFLAGRPPAGSFNDTKAEENGWNLTCLAVAANMFPTHPHADAWKEKAIEYMMNTLSAPQDAEDQTRVDGRPVKEWFTGANVHPDFTLENHGFFHPGYVGCSSYFMTQTAMYFTYAHQPVPAAASHHLLDTWHMFQGILLPNGEAACPQGMDWELHGLPYINLFASLACWQKDSLAARLEENYLQYVRAWEVKEQGNMAIFGSPLGFTRHAICTEQATFGFLAHNIFGAPAKEVSASDAAQRVEGVQARDWIKLVTHRTEDKFVSFSWTNHLMGMLIPIGRGHEGNPDFTVPIVNGFVGQFELSPKDNTKPTVLERAWKTNANGFETSGTLMLNGGHLKQTLTMTSIGDKTVVYQDRVIAQADVTIAQEGGLPLGIENDDVTGSSRQVYWQNGRAIFEQHKPQPPMAIPGSWINVDGRLGVVAVTGSGISYNQAKGYAGGIAVCTDVLYGSFSNQKRHFKAGEEVARRVALCFVEVTPSKTAKLAKSFKIENRPDGQWLRFKTPEGNEVEIQLLKPEREPAL